jgi:class 3 adenylate cyclase
MLEFPYKQCSIAAKERSVPNGLEENTMEEEQVPMNLPKRRLATVLAADMAGYARLMETDEIGVLDRQRAHRRELIDSTIEKFNGKIVKTTGDGMLLLYSPFATANLAQDRSAQSAGVKCHASKGFSPLTTQAVATYERGPSLSPPR